MSLKVLLLCNKPVESSNASTILDHINSFSRYSKNEIYELSMIGDFPSQLSLDRFDCLIIHYTLQLGHETDHFLSPKAQQLIRNFTGLKIVFIQDEYRNVNLVIERLLFMRIGILYTLLPPSEIEKVYPSEKLSALTVIPTLAGFVPEDLKYQACAPIKDRPIDIVYRARRMPFWLGDLSQEKIFIAEEFNRRAVDYPLVCDVSCEEQDRIYGDGWIQFLKSSKATLGVESGASVFDFSGMLRSTVDRFVQDNPDASYELVKERFFSHLEGKIYLNTVSPRVFEAAALRVVMVLFVGEYSGLLKPMRHYIPLEKDFSNIDFVIQCLQDEKLMQSIADSCFEEIANNPKYSYDYFVGEFDRSLASHFAKSNHVVHKYYTRKQFSIIKIISLKYFFQRNVARFLQAVLLSTGLRGALFSVWLKLPIRLQMFIRPVLKIIGR